MVKNELKKRFKTFALDIIKLIDDIPQTIVGRPIANQIIRSGTSSAANYRASCRAKSIADFISKMGTVEEELDETAFWLELLEEGNVVSRERLGQLIKETDELLSITIASIKTAKKQRTA